MSRALVDIRILQREYLLGISRAMTAELDLGDLLRLPRAGLARRFGKALLLDFNYDTEPLPGKFPVPGVGPMSLLKNTRANHLGKLAFRHIYWNVLLPGRSMPISTHMSMAGKIPLTDDTTNNENQE